MTTLTTSNTSNKFKVGITHSGQFHADDVCSAWLLRKLNPEIKFTRVSRVPVDIEDDAIVFDIGLGKFDHHQPDRAVRPDGTPYAAFGLLWREFGNVLVNGNQDAFELFDRTYVLPIDAYDNGVKIGIDGPVLMFSVAVATLNQNWDSNESPDKLFEDAINWASFFLDRALESVMSKTRAKALVEQAISKSTDGILVLEQFAPWQEWVCTSTDPKAQNIMFCVYPSNRGGYVAQGVPKVLGQRGNRLDFPTAWRGLNPAELAKITGVLDAEFCHMAGFIAGASSKEGAIELAKLAIAAN